MASRKSESDTPAPVDLAELNTRIAEEAAAATTAEARGQAAAGGGLAGVTTSDVS